MLLVTSQLFRLLYCVAVGTHLATSSVGVPHSDIQFELKRERVREGEREREKYRKRQPLIL